MLVTFAANSTDQHTEVAMRLIGHKVMQQIGDSSSVVLPIKREGTQYQISFSVDFAFEPSSLALLIDSILRATEVSEKYIVEFVSCDSNQVINSYEVMQSDTIAACRGRLYPKACYKLFITLLDDLHFELNTEQESSIHFGWIVFSVLGLGLIAVYFLRAKPIEKADVPADENDHLLVLGKFVFDTKNLTLALESEKTELTGKEADLLQLLHASANETVEREAILKAVWGDEGDYVGRTLDVFISKLRKKLEADTNVRIMSIRGVGYKLVLN